MNYEAESMCKKATGAYFQLLPQAYASAINSGAV